MWLVPLAILELYLRAGASPAPWVRRSATGVMAIAVVLTAWGIFATAIMLWLPLMR
jgi:hypothetical protein